MSTATMTAQAVPEFRAAGTDLSERRRSGVSKGPLIDIVAGGDTSITWAADGAATIGAFATIATIAADARIKAAYPGVSAAAQGLATPQIRHLATLGGNLAQRSRCWYFRKPHIDCLKKGGTDCPARSGNHLYGVAFDLGPCVAPHPSTMAAALLAYEAKIVTDRRSGLSVRDVLGDASNGRADHALGPGEMIKQIVLGVPLAGERALYKACDQPGRWPNCAPVPWWWTASSSSCKRRFKASRPTPRRLPTQPGRRPLAQSRYP
jgi:xanthine dehydrogenase YagS FAD-binding subunit